MAVQVVVPSLGLGWNSGRLVEWCRPDGASVAQGEPILILESDHVVVEVEAEAPGVLRHRHAAEGHCPPGEVLALILEPGERMPAEGETDAVFEPADAPAYVSPVVQELDPQPDAPAATEEIRPAAILPLRRNVIPAPPTVDDTESPWAPIPGDEVAVPEEWIAADHQNEDSPAAMLPDAWADDEPAETPWDEPVAVAPAEPTTGTMLYDPEPETEDLSWETRFEQRFAAQQEPVLEPPLKHHSDDPRPYFDIAPLAEGVTEMRADVTPDAEFEAEPTPYYEPDSDFAPFAAMPVQAVPAAREVMSLRVSVDLRESRKMRTQLAREWRDVQPADEDVVLRAFARALEELRMDVPGNDMAVIVPDRDAPSTTAVRDTSRRPFRDAVEARFAGGDGDFDEEPVGRLVSFASVGIEEGTPDLPVAHPFALSLGAAREWAVVEGDRAVPVPFASLVLAYDPARIPSHEAAWLLARVRELVEAPYALLAA